MGAVISDLKGSAAARVTQPPPLLVRDPICGMEFNPAGAAATRFAEAATYYFCSATCADEFDRRHLAVDGASPAVPLLLGMTTRPPAAVAPRAPGWLVPAVCAVAVAAVVAVTLFGVPISTVFVYGLVLACPLMHLFMMRGHGNHTGDTDRARDGASATAQSSNRACH